MNGKKAKVKEFFDQFLLQALAEFVALAAVISFLGMYVYDKMDILLIDSLKESIAQQSQSTAYALGERFQHKLDELKTRAELLQEGRISAEDAVEIDTIGTREGRLRGILRRDNTVVAGAPLPSSAAAAISRVWLGLRPSSTTRASASSLPSPSSWGESFAPTTRSLTMKPSRSFTR